MTNKTSVTMKNEPAERWESLLAALEPHEQGWMREMLKNALTAERRATVERIREQLLGTLTASHEVRAYRADVEGILDEEAAR